MKDIRRFYKELGNLFYAIAAVDNVAIKQKEKEVLDEEIRHSWKNFDKTTDRFGSDRAFMIEYEFETMEDELVPPREAYASFETYFLENEHEIDKLTRKRIFSTALHIAASVRKINKNELGYLLRLKKLMKI